MPSAYLPEQRGLLDRPGLVDQQVPLVVMVQMAVRVRQDQQVQLVPLVRQPDSVPQAHLPVLLVLLPVVPTPLKYSHSLSLLVLQDLRVLLVLPDQLGQPEMTVAMVVPDQLVLPDLQDRQVLTDLQAPQDLLEPQQVSVHQRQALVL